MNVKNNYANAIATLGDWLKNLAPIFQPNQWRFVCAIFPWL